MKARVLRHKTLQGVFGLIDETADGPVGTCEIYHIHTPQLHPATATMEAMVEYWGKQMYGAHVIEQLKDYDMVEVDVIIPATTGSEIGNLLFNIHTHAESLRNPDEIVYREEDIIQLLKTLGLPEPVWED